MSSSSAAGDMLRRVREQRQESLRQAASSLTVTPSHLSRLERGEKGASEDLLRRAAEHYGLDLATLKPMDIPADVVQMIRDNPELIEEIRQRYGRSHD